MLECVYKVSWAKALGLVNLKYICPNKPSYAKSFSI